MYKWFGNYLKFPPGIYSKKYNQQEICFQHLNMQDMAAM